MSHARRLILIRHSLPAVDPAVPASEWTLGDEGRRRCESLAQRLRAYHPDVIIASVEPKAVETATIVADRLGVPPRTLPGLHEHERRTARFEPDLGAFESTVARFFAERDALVFGEETARAAGDRFSRAVAAVVDSCRAHTLAIVAHGTVISLFVARHNRIDPYVLWQRLGLPSFVVLELRSLTLRAVVASIDGDSG